jgi:hypothetical protein
MRQGRFSQDAMKNSPYFAALIALTIGMGCQSNQNRVSHTFEKPGPEAQPAQPTYTIEEIPTTHLSPTSREGDKSGAIYSSNIIAVYVNAPGRTNGGVTNGGGGYFQGNR